MTDQGELGAALRGWRDRVSPADAGLPAGRARRAPGLRREGLGPLAGGAGWYLPPLGAGRARRAPGLRREELALLAGVSADYITRLEQGRATAPSPQVLGALGRALRLSHEEQDHLFRLAGSAPPRPGQISGQLPPSVQRLLDQLTGVPVGVNDAGWNLVAWNRLWAALTGDPSARTGRDRNILWGY